MAHKFTNKQIMSLLREVSACLEAKDSDAFRIRAYNNAVDSIEKTDSDIIDLWREGKLREVPGIGKGLEEHLNELFKTGKVKHFIDVKKGFPKGMFELLKIPGVGAKTAYKLSAEFGLNSADTAINKLKDLAGNGEVRVLEGFGEESEKKILLAIEKMGKKESRMLLYEADVISDKIIEYLKKCEHVIKVHPLGSLRRRSSTVGDIDISVATNNSKDVIDFFVKYEKVVKVISKGDIKASVVVSNNVQVDLMTQKLQSYGSLLQHFTGSKLHNIHLRTLAMDKGLSLSEHGIKKGSQTLKFDSEEAFYSYLGLEFIPPELREDIGEIELSIKHRIPKLVSETDIKGDLQMHTTLSDGDDSLEDMVHASKNLGRKYIGITDHQISLNTNSKECVNSIIEKQRSNIEQINYSQKDIRVLYGIEINVSSSGDVVYNSEMLSKFDFAIGAIHSSFNQPKDKITKRLLTLIENPYIKIIAHPSGRLIGERDAYDVDWDIVFKACAKHGKVLEINGQPSRLDLPDLLVKQAKKYGILFSTNTDAHSVNDLNHMNYAVSVARRGWCEKKDIINTLSLEDLLKFLNVPR